MSQTRFLIATLFCLLPALGPLSAQGLSGPADSPPPGFAGTEYVDGRGCVFARASIDGVVTWVPRRDATRVQVKVTFNNGQFWTSAFMPQDLRLELKQ